MSYGSDYAHSGIAPETTLAVGVTTASDTTITVASGTGWPSPTGGQLSFGVFNPDTATESKFTYTGRAGAVLSGVLFSQDGSTAAATYAIGVAVRHVFSAQEAGEANDAVRYTVGLIQAAGDLIYGSAANVFSRLAKGSAFQTLGMNSGATAPSWQASASSVLTAAGDVLYASAANTLARLAKGSDGQVLTLASGVPSWATPSSAAPMFVGCVALRTATQSINTATATAVSFTATDVLDSDAFHDPASNASRFTVPSGKAGKYMMSGYAGWAGAANGSRQIVWRLNGTDPSSQFADTRTDFGGTGFYQASPTQVYDLAVGDYVEMVVTQTSGGAINITGASAQITRVGT